MPRKISCTVESITDHGERVYTLDLAPSVPVPAFRPGQFLHLTVDDYDPSSFWPESRVFSIASSPRDRRRIRICYSVKGRYTTKMEAALKVGGTVWIKLPYGDFIIDDATNAVLVAGGTGISAFTAFLEAMAPAGAQRVTLVYGARTPALFLFQEMISAQLMAVPNFNALFFAETQPAARNPDCAGAVAQASSQSATRNLQSAIDALPGRISMDTVWSRLADPASNVFYLSGPPVMLNALSADLKSRGIPPERIRTDAWE